MEDIVIRPAAPEDAPTWLALRNALWPSEDHALEIAAYFDGKLDEPEEVFLAFRDGAPIVLLELSIRHDIEGVVGVRTGYIEGLYVAPNARSFRLNRLLIAAARSWALKQHCRVFASDRSGRLFLFSPDHCGPSEIPHPFS